MSLTVRPTLRDAAQQALEALERADKISGYGNNRKAITALRAALAEDAMQRLTDVQQEMNCYGDGNVYRGQRSKDSQTPTLTINWMPAVEGPLSKAHRISQESRQVEPVAWMTHGNDLLPLFHKNKQAALGWGENPRPLYTAPPKREPLTSEELKSIREHQRLLEELGPVWAPMLYYFCRAIERAHGIGGEG